RGLGESARHRTAVSPGAGRADQLVDQGRAMSVIERLLRRDGNELRPTIGDVTLEPMRRRDLRHGVMAIESASYPRPWSRGVFESELAQVRSGDRLYLVARHQAPHGHARAPIVGYAGLWFTPDEA